MKISIEDLLKGKATIIKDREYLPTRSYVEPFLERMSKFTDDFRVEVRLPDQITKLDSTEDITYNRVWIQAVMPKELEFENHYEAIHLLYALDSRKPLFKIARSAINGACLNQCVFSPTFINTQLLESNTPADFSCLTRLMEQTNDIISWLNKLNSIKVPYDNNIINLNLGSWVRKCISNYVDSEFGKIKLAISTAVDAYKLLYEKKESPYYISRGEESTMFNIYNAFTDIVSHDNKDITNPLEKTLLLKDILSIV
jgi:hypothetical protein